MMDGKAMAHCAEFIRLRAENLVKMWSETPQTEPQLRQGIENLLCEGFLEGYDYAKDDE